MKNCKNSIMKTIIIIEQNYLKLTLFYIIFNKILYLKFIDVYLLSIIFFEFYMILLYFLFIIFLFF